MKPNVRKWHVDQALHSTRSLLAVLSELSEVEIEAALEIESASRRRRSIMQRLIGRAAELARQKATLQLSTRYQL